MRNNDIPTLRHYWVTTKITNGDLTTKLWPNFQSVIAECKKQNPDYPFKNEIGYIALLCDLYFEDAENRKQRIGLVKEIIKTAKEIDAKHNSEFSGPSFSEGPAETICSLERFV